MPKAKAYYGCRSVIANNAFGPSYIYSAAFDFNTIIIYMYCIDRVDKCQSNKLLDFSLRQNIKLNMT